MSARHLAPNVGPQLGCVQGRGIEATQVVQALEERTEVVTNVLQHLLMMTSVIQVQEVIVKTLEQVDPDVRRQLLLNAIWLNSIDARRGLSVNVMNQVT